MQTHPWNVSISEATQIQNRLRDEIKLVPLKHPPKTIAGADISYNRFSDDFFACVVVLSLPELKQVECVYAKGVATFPYVAGYLSFREIPTLLKAFEKLKTPPDVVMADGQGIAHPRRMGIAAHLGLLLDLPTFGCGKSLLYGKAEEPDESRGSISYLHDPSAGGGSASGGKDLGEMIGALVRTKDSVKPVIISPGHKITLEESIELVLATSRGYRIPEPTRRAHELVNQFRRGEIRA